MSDLEQFLNRVRILYCVDGDEIERAMQSTGLEMNEARWRRFRDNPLSFMIQSDGPTQRALWSIVLRREAKTAERTATKAKEEGK